jgi:hypothetical protein
MYRADGPEELKSLGETEFVCGVAAMSASGNYGPACCIAGVVGCVDLRLASRAKGVLERHIAIFDGRIRGIRNGSTWSDDPVLKRFGGAAGPGLYLGKNFREGFAALVALDLLSTLGSSRPNSATSSIWRMPSRRRGSCSITSAVLSRSVPMRASCRYDQCMKLSRNQPMRTDQHIDFIE